MSELVRMTSDYESIKIRLSNLLQLKVISNFQYDDAENRQ